MCLYHEIWDAKLLFFYNPYKDFKILYNKQTKKVLATNYTNFTNSKSKGPWLPTIIEIRAIRG